MANTIIENGNQFNPFNQNGKNQAEFSISDLLQILNRQRVIILLTAFLVATAAGVFTYFMDPVYESKAVLKKEVAGKNQMPDQFSRMVATQGASGEIETESELLKSRGVLEKVIQDLDLYFILESIEVPGVVSYTFDVPLEDYKNELAQYPQTGAPRIEVEEFNAMPGFRELPAKSYIIQVNNQKGLDLLDAETEERLDTHAADSIVVFQLPLVRFRVEWPNPKPGSTLLFHIKNLEETLIDNRQSIGISTPPNTTLLVVSVQNSSPYMTQRIANTIATKFRETRIEHKRETIRYSSNFVDDQLEEIKVNLKTSEEALSAFRGDNQLTDIDASTRDALDFLSTLEAEKIQTDLLLSENRSKLENLRIQSNNGDFFDQTYLTPQTESGSNYTPFSSLLEQLSNTELERLELLQKRTESHPDVVAVNQKIDEITRSLAQFNQNTLKSYEIIISSLENKQADLSNLISTYSRKARTLASSEADLMELMRDKNLYEKMYLLLSDKREEMRIAELSRLQDIIIVEAAVIPIEPILPKKKINVLIGLILGMMAGLTLGLIREFNGKTITTLSEIEDKLMIPILAILPTYPTEIREKIKKNYTILNHLELLTDTQFGFKESYRMLRTKLSFILSTKRSPIKNNLLFTSCEENTGKTTVVTNFSLLLSMAGKRILVIDCDLKNPTIGRFFNIPFNAPGLIDFLTHDYITTPDIYTPLDDPAFQDVSLFNPTIRMEDREMDMAFKRYSLDVIPAGGSIDHSSELLDSDKFKDYLLEISSSYDYILIDTPPVTRTVDALTLGNFVKNAVLVVKPNYTRKDNLNRAIQDFRQFNVHLLGSVINACDIKRFADDYGYGYGYGYSYQYEPQYPELPEASIN
ncbi:MAG: GumC family protein [Rhodothermales bacterium]